MWGPWEDRRTKGICPHLARQKRGNVRVQAALISPARLLCRSFLFLLAFAPLGFFVCRGLGLPAIVSDQPAQFRFVTSPVVRFSESLAMTVFQLISPRWTWKLQRNEFRAKSRGSRQEIGPVTFYRSSEVSEWFIVLQLIFFHRMNVQLSFYRCLVRIIADNRFKCIITIPGHFVDLRSCQDLNMTYQRQSYIVLFVWIECKQLCLNDYLLFFGSYWWKSNTPWYWRRVVFDLGWPQCRPSLCRYGGYRFVFPRAFEW